jgi:hypothetical protein
MKELKWISLLLVTMLLPQIFPCKSSPNSKEYRKLNLNMIHLPKTKHNKNLYSDRRLFADVIPKAIQEAGIKAYPEFKYKNIQGGSMNIILPKSRPFVVYNTYPITQHRVDSHYTYPHIPMLSNVPRINI